MIRPSHPISTVKNNKYNKDKEIFDDTKGKVIMLFYKAIGN